MRVTDRDDWQRLWIDDKIAIMQTMRNNIASDIINWYNLLGYNIQKQITDIIKYENDYDRQILEFGNMTNEQVNKWCYYDLKKRGAIG